MSQHSDLDKPPEASNAVKTHVYLPPRIHEEKYQAHVPVFDDTVQGENDEWFCKSSALTVWSHPLPNL